MTSKCHLTNDHSQKSGLSVWHQSTSQAVFCDLFHRLRERKPMKKTTILIYKDYSNPAEGLREATQEEWSEILHVNKGLPMCQRRCFVEDCFEDCGTIDRMFMEVPYMEYLKWDRERKKKSRNDDEGRKYQHISLDYQREDDDGISFVELIDDGFDLEADIVSRDDITAIHRALEQWRPWAIELLENYLAGKRRHCTQTLCEKYGVSAVVIRKRKREFEKFVQKFFEDRGFVFNRETSC